MLRTISSWNIRSLQTAVLLPKESMQAVNFSWSAGVAVPGSKGGVTAAYPK